MRAKILVAVVLASSFCVPSCSESPQSQQQISAKVGAFFASKTTKQILSGITTIGLNAGVSALTQYGLTGQVDAHAITSAASFGAADLLRSLQGTAKAADPKALTLAVTQGAGVPEVASVLTAPVVAAISKAAEKGVPPDLANEQMAKALDKFASNPAAAALDAVPASLTGP